MHLFTRGPAYLPRWICLPLAVALGLFAQEAGAQRQQIVAAQVVTAPWATSPRPGKAGTEAASSYTPPPLAAAPGPPPLSAEARRTLQATKSEKLAEPKWLRFVVSNEWRHDVTFPRLVGLGGAYVGVATDQNYTLAAAARAEVVFLFDYDLEVVRLHRIYHAFLDQAATPAEFRALFDEKEVKRGKEILATAADSPKEVAHLQRIYTHYRERLQIYLRHVANLQVGDRHPTWLGDPVAYAYIRGLAQGGRMVAVQGDLNGSVALRSVGETARALKLPVRIVYLSNAEGFFKYSPAFRENLAALPHDERSVIIRTYKHGFPAAAGDSWHYNLHQIDDFLKRAARPGYPSVHQIMADLRSPEGKKAIQQVGLSYYDGAVPGR
jgi:hypothetical protein